MTTTVKKWGNSQGLRVPKAMLEEANLDVGSEVEMTTDGDCITIRPVQRRSRRIGRYTIEQLVADQPEHPETDENVEVDWGPPVGREVW